MKPRIYLAALTAAALAGCANTASPVLHAGQYYMIGDDNCITAFPDSNARVICYDEEGIKTGYRNAMTQAELQMWTHQQQMAAIEQRQLQLEQEARSARIREQFPLPSVQTDNSSRTVYNQVGSSVIGSNGVTYKQVGNSIIGSDGTVCQSVGSQLICN